MEGGYGEELCSVPRGISNCEMTSDFPPKPAKGREQEQTKQNRAEQSRAEQSQKKKSRQSSKHSRLKQAQAVKSVISVKAKLKLMREIFCLP